MLLPGKREEPILDVTTAHVGSISAVTACLEEELVTEQRTSQQPWVHVRLGFDAYERHRRQTLAKGR
jgi:hypothetical protein